MFLYSGRPVRAVFQVAFDLIAVVWCIVWVQIGQAVRGAVAQLAEPVRGLQAAGDSYDATFDSLGARVAGLPLVGDQLAEAFSSASTPGGAVSADAAGLVADIERYATTLGAVTTWLPILVYVLPWLAMRVRFVTRAVENTRLAKHPGSRSLLAMRALARRPLRDLMSISPDPAEAWRRGDPEAVDGLVALELRDSGARPPRRR